MGRWAAVQAAKGAGGAPCEIALVRSTRARAIWASYHTARDTAKRPFTAALQATGAASTPLMRGARGRVNDATMTYSQVVHRLWGLLGDHFGAHEAVSALVEARLAEERGDAVELCAMMLQDGVFLRVVPSASPFADDHTRYRLTWGSAEETRRYVLLQRAPAVEAPPSSLLGEGEVMDFDDRLSEASDSRAPELLADPWPRQRALARADMLDSDDGVAAGDLESHGVHECAPESKRNVEKRQLVARAHSLDPASHCTPRARVSSVDAVVAPCAGDAAGECMEITAQEYIPRSASADAPECCPPTRAASVDAARSRRALPVPSVKRRAALLQECRPRNRVLDATPEPLPNVLALREKLSRAFCSEPSPPSVSRVSTEHDALRDSVEHLCASPVTAAGAARRPRNASRRRLLSMLGPRAVRVRRGISRSPSYVASALAPQLDEVAIDMTPAPSVRVSSTFTESEAGSNARLHSKKMRSTRSIRDRIVESLRRGKRPFGGRDAFEDRVDATPTHNGAWRDAGARV